MINKVSAFTIGAGAGMVAILTAQKRREESSQNQYDSNEEAHSKNANRGTVDEKAVTFKQNYPQSYLDSLPVVSSVGRGTPSYFDSLSNPPPPDLDSSDGDIDAAQ